MTSTFFKNAKQSGFSLIEVSMALAIAAAAAVIALGIQRDQLVAENAQGFAVDLANLYGAIDSSFTGTNAYSGLSTKTLAAMQLVPTASISYSGGTAQILNRYGGRIYADGWARTPADPLNYQLLQSTSIPMNQCRRVIASLSAGMKRANRLVSYLIAVAGPPTGTGTRIDDRLPNPLTLDASGNIVGAGGTGIYEAPVIMDYAFYPNSSTGLRLSEMANFCERDIQQFTILLLALKG